MTEIEVWRKGAILRLFSIEHTSQGLNYRTAWGSDPQGEEALLHRFDKGGLQAIIEPIANRGLKNPTSSAAVKLKFTRWRQRCIKDGFIRVGRVFK